MSSFIVFNLSEFSLVPFVSSVILGCSSIQPNIKGLTLCGNSFIEIEFLSLDQCSTALGYYFTFSGMKFVTETLYERQF